MQVVTISRLLESAIPCSSTSMFLSELSFSPSVISPGVSDPVLSSEAIQKVLGKRSRDKLGAKTGTTSEKRRPVRQMIKVLPQSWIVVGRLQLCNQTVHYWNGFYVSADCVALTDATATICCCICQGPDPSFLGKIVRVNSWSFIPRRAIPLKGVLSSGASNSDCQLGILEIHDLEVVEGQPSEETILPSLFVNLAAANGGKLSPEIPLLEQEALGKGSSLRGIPHSISPPFILPCRHSEDNIEAAKHSFSQTASCRMRGRKEHSNEKFPQKPMLGFFVEIQSCFSYSPACFDIRNNSVKCEMHGPRKPDDSGQSTAPGCFPRVSSETEHTKATTQQGFIDENFSSSSMSHVAAGTLGAKTLLELEESLSHVYFAGSVCAWRPVLSGALGQCVTITGLRKKLILVGKEKKPHTIFLSTQKTLITLDCGREVLGGTLKASPLRMPGVTKLAGREPNMRSDLPNTGRGKVRVDCRDFPNKKFRPGFQFGNNFDRLSAVERGKDSSPSHGNEEKVCMELVDGKGLDKGNRVISFVGIVTASLFQGTLLELDERVWLLLTHQRHTELHGLRIGAMLSLTDVHSITIKDLTGKFLLLGACMQSHVSVVQFSPLLKKTSFQVHSKSLLLKYLQRLSFISTFWLLSVIRSFAQKFRHIYSNNELLGAKKDPGIIQKYAQRMIAPDVSPERDVVNEFFHKQCCRLGDSLSSAPIMQVPPIATFCEHIQAVWESSVGAQRNWAKNTSASGQLRQLTIASHDLGIILLGSLQICRTSGKLHLLDATGTINVMIPDLLSSEHLSRTYQVKTPLRSKSYSLFFALGKRAKLNAIRGANTRVYSALYSAKPFRVRRRNSEESRVRELKLLLALIPVPSHALSDITFPCLKVSRFTVVLEGLGPAKNGSSASVISWSRLLKEGKTLLKSKLVKYTVHFFMRDATHLHDLDWCESVTLQTGPLYHPKEKACWQKQMEDRWAKSKSHLDFLRLCFQSQTTEAARVGCSDHGLGILCENVGESACSDHLFRVSCKVVTVKLLVFEWPGGPAVGNLKPPAWLGVKGSATSRKSLVGIPLTLACFVVDDGSGPVDCWALGDVAVSLLGLANLNAEPKLRFSVAIMERILTNLAVESDMQPFVGSSLEQILCHMTQRYGQLILQSSDPHGDSPRYLMHSKGGKSLEDDERSLMDLLLSSACLNGPLVIVGKNVPSMERIFSVDSKTSSGPHEVLPCCRSSGHQRGPSPGNSTVQMLAHSVDKGVRLIDLQAIVEEVAGLLYD